MISTVCMGSAVERWGVLEMGASCLLILPLLPTLSVLSTSATGLGDTRYSVARNYGQRTGVLP